MIRAGELDLATVQSDWQYHAYHGSRKFEAQGPNKELRAIFSVHAEPVNVVVRTDSGIKHFRDLKGKRVNLGNAGSGTRATMEVIMDAYGWNISDFKLASELKSSEQSAALCDNKVDAIVFPVGNPSGTIKEATTSCDAIIVDVTGPEIDKLVKDNDFYRYAIIPGGMYRGTPKDVHTFGVGATFVASTAVPEDVVYNVVKAVFDNFEDFKKLHPAFAHLVPAQMIKDGLSAPLHKGAIKYYKEVGLM